MSDDEDDPAAQPTAGETPRRVIKVGDVTGENEPDHLPAEFTTTWLDSLTLREVNWLEQHQEQLTDSQRAAFRHWSAARLATLTKKLKESFAKPLLDLKLFKSPVIDIAAGQQAIADRMAENSRRMAEDISEMQREQAAQKADRKRRADEHNKSVQEFMQLTAMSTKALADEAVSQRSVTYVVAVAVLFQVIDGSFDAAGKTLVTRLISLGAAVLVLVLAGRGLVAARWLGSRVRRVSRWLGRRLRRT